MKSLAKLHPALIGLLQTMGLIIYCGSIATFFYYTAGYTPDLPQGIIMFMILIMLVLSAGITGFLVFGYPAYLALNKEVKRSLSVLGYTFLFSGILVIGMMILVATNLPSA